MSENQPSPGLKAALEYGPILAFFVGYMLLRERAIEIGGTEYSGLIVVTAFFVPLLAFTTWLGYRLFGAISKMQIVTLVIVVIFGGLTVWLNDERFIKMKPTVIYGLFAGVLGFGLLRGRSYLQLFLRSQTAVELVEPPHCSTECSLCPESGLEQRPLRMPPKLRQAP